MLLSIKCAKIPKTQKSFNSIGSMNVGNILSNGIQSNEDANNFIETSEHPKKEVIDFKNEKSAKSSTSFKDLVPNTLSIRKPIEKPSNIDLCVCDQEIYCQKKYTESEN